MPNPHPKPSGHKFTKENAREMQRRGQAKQREVMARRKAMREELKILLKLAAKKKGGVVTAEQLQSLALEKGVNCDAQTALLISMIQSGIDGNVDAAKFVRDTVGEKPTDKVEVDASKTIEAYAKSHKLKI